MTGPRLPMMGWHRWPSSRTGSARASGRASCSKGSSDAAAQASRLWSSSATPPTTLGFVPGSRFGIGYECDVPDDVFLICELHQDALRGLVERSDTTPAFAAV